MNTSTNRVESNGVDLSEYAERILAEEDRPLFCEAVVAAQAGGLRAAYIVIWLACAESLKRRFKEASTRDHTAIKVVGAIEKSEKDHRAIDKYLLEQALKYGFISDSAHNVLSHIYEMRCLFAHPYQQAPSKEKLVGAASEVVDLVLSNPVKLREGFGAQLLKDLLETRNYLDDLEPTVAAFVKTIHPRLDESIHIWLLNKYWDQLEKLSDDPSMAIFVRRGVWFSRAFLDETGVSVLDHNQWHDKVLQLPKSMTRICSTAVVFANIGQLAQDALIGSAFAESAAHPSVLADVEKLLREGALSERQAERFHQEISGFPFGVIESSGLSTRTCYDRLLEALTSPDFHTQNAAVDVIVSNGPDQAAELDEKQQVGLGRSVLQSAERNAWTAINFVRDLSHRGPVWPPNVILGLALELFSDEGDMIRFRVRYVNEVFAAVDQLEGPQHDQVVCEVRASVERSTEITLLLRGERDSVNTAVESYPWAEPLWNKLKDKIEQEQSG